MLAAGLLSGFQVGASMSLLPVAAVWLVLCFTHAKFVSCVVLSVDTHHVLHASSLKLLLYVLTIRICV
jgi:hypothetical protein